MIAQRYSIPISATVCLRLLLFPIVIQAQKTGAKMQEHMPEMMRLQGKMMDVADKEEARKAQTEYLRYMEKNNVSPFSMYVPMLGSGFFFTSMFFALRDEFKFNHRDFDLDSILIPS